MTTTNSVLVIHSADSHSAKCCCSIVNYTGRLIKTVTSDDYYLPMSCQSGKCYSSNCCQAKVSYTNNFITLITALVILLNAVTPK